MSPVRARMETFCTATAFFCWVGLLVCCVIRRPPPRTLRSENSPSTIFRMRLGEKKSDPETEAPRKKEKADLLGTWRVLNPETMTPVWLEGRGDGLRFFSDGTYSWTRLGGGAHETRGTYRLSKDTLTLEGLGPTPLVLGFQLRRERRLVLFLPDDGRSLRLNLGRSRRIEGPP